jgi:hypothetical protein
VEIAKRWKELSDDKKTSHHNEALEVTFIKTMFGEKFLMFFVLQDFFL